MLERSLQVELAASCAVPGPGAAGGCAGSFDPRSLPWRDISTGPGSAEHPLPGAALPAAVLR